MSHCGTRKRSRVRARLALTPPDRLRGWMESEAAGQTDTTGRRGEVSVNKKQNEHFVFFFLIASCNLRLNIVIDVLAVSWRHVALWTGATVELISCWAETTGMRFGIKPSALII